MFPVECVIKKDSLEHRFKVIKFILESTFVYNLQLLSADFKVDHNYYCPKLKGRKETTNLYNNRSSTYFNLRILHLHKRFHLRLLYLVNSSTQFLFSLIILAVLRGQLAAGHLQTLLYHVPELLFSETVRGRPNAWKDKRKR